MYFALASMLVQLAEALPTDVKVLIVADRGFGDQKLYQVLTEELKFDYLIPVPELIESRGLRYFSAWHSSTQYDSL